jgi:hypothetical protein
MFLNLENYLSYADLEMLYLLNDYLFQRKNEDIQPFFQGWYKLYEKVKPQLTTLNTGVIENIRSLLSKTPVVFLSFVNNGQLSSFQETIHSITNTWMDVDKVDSWFCVDQTIKGDDRSVLRKKYKWMQYHFDGGDVMEIIFAKLKELRPSYWIHIENGVFHTRMNYVVQTIDNAQIKYNRCRSKTIRDYTIKNYMKMEGEFIENTEMSTQVDFSFSITPVASILKQNPKTFQGFTKLWKGPTKFLNRITFEV